MRRSPPLKDTIKIRFSAALVETSDVTPYAYGTLESRNRARHPHNNARGPSAKTHSRRVEISLYLSRPHPKR